VGERLNRWSDLREILTQNCDVSFCENSFKLRHTWLNGVNEFLPVLLTFLGLFWVKLCVRYLHMTKFSAGGFRENWRREGGPSITGAV
jgi:hypothetical protein